MAVAFLACSSTAENDGSTDPRMDAGLKRDSAPVDPPTTDAAYPGTDDAGAAPSCDSYCDDVMAACTGDDQQYADRNECIAMCAIFPTGKAGETDTSSVGCRAQFAGSPAKTDPSKYCAAAGPFGGNQCGDRCTAFCQLVTAECTGDAGSKAPYTSYASCLTACASFQYDGDAGDHLDGPTGGNTLNCRAFFIRKELRGEGNGCEQVGTQSASCKN